MTRHTSLAMILLVAALQTVGPLLHRPCMAAAADFRVDNRIYMENDKEPCVETTTLFHDGVVYDYLKAPQEITVFDRNNERFMLLDVARRVKTEVKCNQVLALSEHLKTWAARQTDPLLVFLSAPRFDQQYHADSGTFVFASPLVTYEINTASAPTEAVSNQYREFSDWNVQLNALLNPGSTPPFARMVVSNALQTRHLLPEEVKLTMRLGSGFPPKRITIRSQHSFTDQLDQSDQDRIVQTGQYLEIFRAIPFEEYQKKVKR